MNNLVVAFATYLRQVKGRSPRTVAQYSDVLEEFTAYVAEVCGPQVALETIELPVLENFLTRGCAPDDEPSPYLWNARLFALRTFYKYLLRMDTIHKNPTLDIEQRTIEPKNQVPLSFDEFLSLVEALKTSPPYYRSRNVAVAQVLYHCALRVSEVVSLNIAQVDFTNYVFHNVRTKGRKWLSVPFNDLVAEALEFYLKDREDLVPHEHETALFLSDRRQRLSVRSVQELIKSYGKEAGIGRTIGPHLLRHSGASELGDLGVPIRVIQDICNHSSITTTERYVHNKGQAQRRAIDLLGATLANRAKERQKERG